MSPPPQDDLTELLHRVRRSEPGAADRFARAIEPQLRRIARRQIEASPDSVLESGALVNEAWMRLFGGTEKDFVNRLHFLRTACRAMRSILVDRIRRRRALKRGSGAEKRSLDEGLAREDPALDALLDLDDALSGLEPDDAELAELRLFGGLTNEEIGILRGTSTRTVERRWSTVRQALRARLER